MKNRLCVCECVLLSSRVSESVLVRMPAYVCACVCVEEGGGSTCVRAFMCARQTGSCGRGQLFLHIVRTSIDNKQVRAEKEAWNQKGTLAFVRVSTRHKAMAIKPDESVTR